MWMVAALIAVPAIAQEQQGGRAGTNIYIDGQTPVSSLPEGALSGSPVDQFKTRTQRQNPEPGRNDAEAANTTTLIVGEGARTQAIVRENVSGQSGLTIGGEPLTPEERARLIAVQNMKNGTVQGVGAQPSDIDTTIHVDSITVTKDAGSGGQKRNTSCVRIGTVGNGSECGTD